LWPELTATPQDFTLYGGTALALRIGHRQSVDFDFSSNQPFDPDRLMHSLPYLEGAERVQVDSNTLTCRVNRGGSVLVSFFGCLNLGQVAARDQVDGMTLFVASLVDLAATKAAVIQKRAEVKDYLDIDALIRHGIDLSTMLAAGAVVYGTSFNPLITLKALSYYDDVPELPPAVRARLGGAATKVDVTMLPTMTPYSKRPQKRNKIQWMPCLSRKIY
jgi:hypothetical protein